MMDYPTHVVETPDVLTLCLDPGCYVTVKPVGRDPECGWRYRAYAYEGGRRVWYTDQLRRGIDGTPDLRGALSDILDFADYYYAGGEGDRPTPSQARMGRWYGEWEPAILEWQFGEGDKWS